MEAPNLIDKYVVSVQRDDGKVFGHPPLKKSRKFAKTIFYFLKVDKNILGESMCLE